MTDSVVVQCFEGISSSQHTLHECHHNICKMRCHAAFGSLVLPISNILGNDPFFMEEGEIKKKVNKKTKTHLERTKQTLSDNQE